MVHAVKGAQNDGHKVPCFSPCAPDRIAASPAHLIELAASSQQEEQDAPDPCHVEEEVLEEQALVDRDLKQPIS